MKRSILASAVLGAALLQGASASAATRFDITFTGLTSNMAWSPASMASGTGFIEVEGYTGLGVELFGGADLSRTVTDFRVDLTAASLGPSVTAPGYPTLLLNDGVASDFRLITYKFSPTALFLPLSPGAYQLTTDTAIYTGVYSLARYVPPPPPPKLPVGGGPDPVSAAPEPATWVSLILGFFGLGAMVRRSRRGRARA